MQLQMQRIVEEAGSNSLASSTAAITGCDAASDGEAGSNYVASSTAAITGCNLASDAEHCWRGRQ